VSWWQFTHLVGTVVVAFPIAIAIGILCDKHALMLAVVVTLAAIGLDHLWNLPATIGSYSAISLMASTVLELLRYLLVLPALTWLVRRGLGSVRSR